MKKFTHFTALILAFALLLSACSGGAGSNGQNASTPPGAEPAESSTIRIGFEGSLCQAPIVLAYLAGFFEAEGLDVQILVTGDLVNTRDAIAGGHIDAAAGMLSGWLIPLTQGIDLQFTLGLHTACASAFVLADSTTTAFLPGQNIAISGSIGGAFHNIGLRFLYQDGFSPDEFTWRDFPPAEAVIALQNGTVDVAVIPDHIGQRFVDEGLLRPIRSLTDPEFTQEACCVLGIAGPFLAQNPETSRKITQAVYSAARWMADSPENTRAAMDLLIEHGYLNVDPEFAATLIGAWQWGLSNEQTQATIFASIVEYQSLRLLPTTFAPADILEQIWHPFDLAGE